jgi:hypothetical protein
MCESVHPCTASLQSLASLDTCRKSCKCERLLLLLRQDAARTGPPVARRAGGGQARRVARRMRASSLRTRMCAQRTPEPAREPGGQDARKACHRGCAFFGYFLCTSKESDPLARRASGSPALSRNNMSKELDSGFRRNDELGAVAFLANLRPPTSPSPTRL